MTSPELLQARSNAQDSYSYFKPLVDELLANPHNYQLLGEGHRSAVYKVSHDGAEYAVRTPLFRPDSKGVVEHFDASHLTADMGRMERIMAISPEQGVTVSEVMLGKGWHQLTAPELRAISDEHIWQYAETAQTAYDRGVSIDYGKSNNFVVDEQEGFGFIDLGTLRIAEVSLIGHLSLASYSLQPLRVGFYPNGIGHIPESIANPDLGRARLHLMARLAVGASALVDKGGFSSDQFLDSVAAVIADYNQKIDDHEL